MSVQTIGNPDKQHTPRREQMRKDQAARKNARGRTAEARAKFEREVRMRNAREAREAQERQEAAAKAAAEEEERQRLAAEQKAKDDAAAGNKPNTPSA